MSKKAFTMMELVIALAIIAILALITVPIAKSKIGKVDKYSYYLAYSAVQDIAANVVAQSEYDFSADDLASASDLFSERLAMYYPSFKYISASATSVQTCNGIGNNGGCASGYICSGGHCVNPNTGTNQAGNAVYVQGPTGGGYGGNTPAVPAAPVEYACYIANCQTYASTGCSCTTCKPGYHKFASICEQDSDDPTPNPPAQPPAEPTYSEPTYSEPTYSDPSVSCAANQYELSGTCKSCDDLETWAEYKNYMPPCPQACARFGMIYSNSKKTCVMPPSAKNFCERINAEYNTRSASCDITAAQMRANVSNGFKDVTPSIKLSNGLNIYIASDLVKIDDLSDAVDKRDRVGYLVYVDSNGNKGKGILYQDVFPFYILMTGKVVPLYNPAGLGGANNVENLAGNVLYDDYSSGNRVVKASQTNVDFKTGACSTRYIQSATYCNGVAVDANCTATSDCRYVINKPMKFFGR